MHPATARLSRLAPWDPPVTRIERSRSPIGRTRDGPDLGAHRVAGMDDPGVGKMRRRFRERGGDDPGSPGEHPGRAARYRVLLEQHHRDALGERRHDHRDRHVPAGADDDVGPHPAQQPARGDGGPGQLGGRAGNASGAAHIDSADVEGLEVETGGDHEALGDPVPAADHGHLVVRPIASQGERDRQCRGQVTPSSPPSDQRAHDSSSLAVDPGRRC